MLKAQLNNLNALDFRARIEGDPEAIVLDVRTTSEFMEGHIDGALHIDYFADDFWENIEKLDATQNIYVYCRSGRRSIRVCTLMKNGGFNNDKIFNLDAGWNEWTAIIGTDSIKRKTENKELTSKY